MKINLYYWNNGVGVVNDAILIKTVLNEYDVVLYDISKNNDYRKGDVGIFIQNIQADQLENNKKNVLLVNEEWLNADEILFLKQFDYLFVKSKYAKELLKNEHSSIIHTGFFSLDRHYFPHNTGKILHFKGKSIQKNHELVWNYKKEITILDSETNYLTENEVEEQLNSHDIHVCCSLYEAWGHYLWEAMSCGKLVICSEIPVFKEYLDPSLVKFVPTKNIYKKVLDVRFLDNVNYKYRHGYFVDRHIFHNIISYKDELLEFQRKKSTDIRNHFLDVMRRNKDKFLNTIKYI